MLTALLLTVALAAPAAAGPSASSDRWELGPLWIDQSTALTWPGLYVPAFTIVPDRRRVHRLSLGLDLRALRGVSLHAVGVEGSDDPDIRARTSGMQSLQGSVPYGWVGMRVQIPRSQWHVDVGRSFVAASAVARAAMGSRGGWSMNLVRPLR